jgi:hypothetical protein
MGIKAPLLMSVFRRDLMLMCMFVFSDKIQSQTDFQFSQMGIPHALQEILKPGFHPSPHKNNQIRLRQLDQVAGPRSPTVGLCPWRQEQLHLGMRTYDVLGKLRKWKECGDDLKGRISLYALRCQAKRENEC